MLIIRPVRTSDHDAVLGLAKLAGIGMTSLPPDPQVLEHKIAHAAASFAGKPKRAQEENFLFVMEDTEKRALVGTTGIIAHVGLTRPFYSYKLSTITQAADHLDIYSLQRVLHMVNDYTGATEIGSIFLHPDYRKDGNGKFLSRCRYLMLAEFPRLFSDVVISEIRGVQDENGRSPFYHHLGRHFFMMEFRKADYIHATQGSQFIADLMPKYPIYVNMLAEEAQAVIGTPLDASRPAMGMLEKEGFHHEGYVDVFDAGPTMQAERREIRTVRRSRRATITEVRSKVEEGERCLISNRRLGDFTICQDKLIRLPEGGVILAEETAQHLKIKVGDSIRHALV